MRRLAVAVLLAAGCAAPAEFVQAVEFPYYHHPRALGERALRRGIVSFSGDERPGSAALRRNAALLRYWAAILPGLQTERKLPGKIVAVQLLSSGPHGVSAVVISNHTTSESTGSLRVYDPA